MFRALSALYFTTGVVFILLEHLAPFTPGLVVKGLLMPQLMLLLFLSRENTRKGYPFVVLALVFSWGGDLLLQCSRLNDAFFLFGLASFLLAQVFYATVFFTTKGPGILFFRRAYLVIPVAIYGIALLWLLYPGLGTMKLPVIAYAVVILTMLLGAIDRYEKVNRQSYCLLLAGAILFVGSDSLIAIDRFLEPFAGARIAIMGTYLAAQWLIVTGIIRE